MQVQPTSFMAKAVVAARNLVINSEVMQERCKYHEGCPDSSNHVHLYDIYRRNKTVQSMRPCAVVGLSDMDFNQIMPGCSVVNLKTAGGVVLTIVDNARLTNHEQTNARDDSDDSYIDFMNFFGGVLDSMDGRLANHSYDGNIGFPFRGIEVLEEPMRVPYTDRASQDYWAGIAVLTWGDE